MPLVTGVAPVMNAPWGMPVPHVSLYATGMSMGRYVVVMGPAMMGLQGMPLVLVHQDMPLQTVERPARGIAHPSFATGMVHVPTGSAPATQTAPMAIGPPMPAVTVKPPTTAPHVNCNARCLVDLHVPDKEPVVMACQELVPARVHLVGLEQTALPHVLVVARTPVVDMVLVTQQTEPAPALRVLL